MFRVSVPATEPQTVGALRKCIDAQLGVPEAEQTLRLMAAAGRPGEELAPTATFASCGVRHGSLVALEYAQSTVPTPAAGSAAASASAPQPPPAVGRRPRDKKARTLDDLVREQERSQIRLETPPDAACAYVVVDEEAAAAFLRECASDGFARTRVGTLYGQFVLGARGRRGVEVSVIHVHRGAEAEAGADDGAALTPDALAEEPGARALARHLGLERVGVIVGRAPRKFRLSAAEVLAAARLQAAWEDGREGGRVAKGGEGHALVLLHAQPRAAPKPKRGGRKLTARSAAAQSDAPERDDAAVDVYQPTPACVGLARKGALRAGVKGRPELLRPAPNMSFVSASRQKLENDTAPVEFFVTRVFNVSRALGWLGAQFEPDVGGAERPEPSDDDVLELREHLRERRAEPLDGVLLDWRLLLCARALLDDERQLEALCDAALEADPARLLGAYGALDEAIGARVGHGDEEE